MKGCKHPNEFKDFRKFADLRDFAKDMDFEDEDEDFEDYLLNPKKYPNKGRTPFKVFKKGQKEDPINDFLNYNSGPKGQNSSGSTRPDTQDKNVRFKAGADRYGREIPTGFYEPPPKKSQDPWETMAGPRLKKSGSCADNIFGNQIKEKITVLPNGRVRKEFVRSRGGSDLFDIDPDEDLIGAYPKKTPFQGKYGRPFEFHGEDNSNPDIQEEKGFVFGGDPYSGRYGEPTDYSSANGGNKKFTIYRRNK